MPVSRSVILRFAGLVIAFTTLFTALSTMTSNAFTDTPLCTDYGQCAQSGRTDHGYAGVETVGHWGMYGGHNCTNYVAYLLGAAGIAQPDYGLGNAANWGPAAAAHGARVDEVPAVGAVAWWSGGAGGLSWAGHVAWVEQVRPGQITISEDNYPGGPFDWRVIRTGSSGWPTGFIHFTVPDGPQQPSVATAPGGAAAVAVVRTDRSLVLAARARPGGSWTSRTVAPAGSAWSAPALVLGPGGLAEIAVQGPGGGLAVYARESVRSTWTMEQVTGRDAVIGAPAAALAADGALEVAARGARGALDLFTAAPRAAAPLRRWTTTVLAGPGSAMSRPATAVAPDGTVEIAVVGPAHSLVLHTGLRDGLWAVRTVSAAGTAFADPSMLDSAGSPLQIATVGPHGAAQLHLAAQVQLAGSTGWTGWTGWTVRALSAAGRSGRTPDLAPAAAGTVEVARVTPGGELEIVTGQAGHSVTVTIPPPGD